MKPSLLEILDRAQTGALLKKDEWDFEKIVLTTRKLVEKYDLRWDHKEVVSTDPALADRLFVAAFELANTVGVYAVWTGRSIHFDASEIQDALNEMPQSLDMGEGKDQRTLFARKIQDVRPPMVCGGNPGVPTPLEIFQPSVVSWMKEPIVDWVTSGSLTHVDGFEIHAGEPTEIVATRRELKLMREGLKMAGRPGMGMLAAQSSITELGDLAVSRPDYMRPCDAHLVPMLNELIIDPHNFARAINSLDYGVRNASLATVMVGGLAGDAPGAALVQAASFMLANLVCKADYHILHPIHIRHIATSTRAVMWVQSIVTQAFARNSPCIIVSDVYPKSGALTSELLFEVAANSIVITVSGGHLEGVGSADGALPNGTGLEVRFMGEVGHAAARQRLDLKGADLSAQQILGKYDYIFKQPGGNPGVRFDQAYDLQNLTPTLEWQQTYDNIKNQVHHLGLYDL
jgi:methylamine---corrinoid protein Co-methyltransferase